MPFDIEGARKSGYSEAEIAQHLAKTNNFDYKGATGAGYTDADIIGQLAGMGGRVKAGPPASAGQILPEKDEAISAFREFAAGGGPHGWVARKLQAGMERLIPDRSLKDILYPPVRELGGKQADIGRAFRDSPMLQEEAAKQFEEGKRLTPEVEPGRDLTTRSLGELAIAPVTFPIQMGQMAGMSVADKLGLIPATDKELVPTLGEFGKEWVHPYKELLKGNPRPLALKAAEEPIFTTVDLAIFKGITSGVIKIGQGGKMRLKIRKELRKQEKEAREAKEVKGDKDAAAKTKVPEPLEEIMLDAGVPAESIKEAVDTLNRVPAFERRAGSQVKEMVDPVGTLVKEAYTSKREKAHITRKKGDLTTKTVAKETPKPKPKVKGERELQKPVAVEKGPGKALEHVPDPAKKAPLPEKSGILPPDIGEQIKRRAAQDVAAMEYGQKRRERLAEEKGGKPKLKAVEKGAILPKEKAKTGPLTATEAGKMLPKRFEGERDAALWTKRAQDKGIGGVPGQQIVEGLRYNLKLLKRQLKRAENALNEEAVADRTIQIKRMEEAIARMEGKGPKDVPPKGGGKAKLPKIEGAGKGAKGVELKGTERLSGYDKLLAEEMVKVAKGKELADSLNDPKKQAILEFKAKESLKKKGILDFAKEKLKDEGGAITFHKKSATEKKFQKSMAKYRKAVENRDAVASSGVAAESVGGSKPVVKGMVDEAIGMEPKVARKKLNKAYEEEYWVPELNSPLSKAGVNFVKTDNFGQYVDTMPAIKAEKLGSKDKWKVVITEKGGYIDSSFGKQFARISEKGEATMVAKDIPKNWKHTLDPGRLIEWADEKFGGELSRKLLRPARDNIRARLAWEYGWDEELAGIMKKHKLKGMKDRKLLGSVMLGEKVKAPQRVLDAVPEIRKLLDRGIEQMNLARVKRGQDPIPKREDYFPWMVEQTFRDKLFSRRTTPEGILERATPPDYIQPNKPFNPRELPREMGYDRYVKEKDAVKVLMDYGRTASRDIFNTNTIYNNKVHAKWLQDMGFGNLSDAISSWTADVFAGRTNAFDAFVDSLPGIRGAARAQRGLKEAKMRVIFPLNLPWNFLIQTSSTTVLLPRVGLNNAVKGLSVFGSSKVQKFVDQTYTHVMKGKSRPEVAELRGTVAEFKGLETRGKLNTMADKLNFFTKFLEKNLTDHAIASGYFEGKRLGLKGRDLLEFASDTGAKVHSMYNFEDLPAFLRSRDLKASFPLQTFASEMMNNVREIGGGRGQFKGKTKGDRTARLLKWYAGAYVANALSQHYLGRDAWTPMSFIPFGASIASLAGFEVSGGRYDAYKPIGIQFTDDTRKAARDAVFYDDWSATRKLMNGWVTVGGVQVERAAATEEAVQQGGVVRAANKTPMFRIEEDEVASSYITGPWATSGGRKRGSAKDKVFIENLLGGTIPEKTRNRKLREIRRKKLEKRRGD